MRSNITVAVLGLSFIAGIMLLGQAYNYKFKTRNTVSVLGSAEHHFTSDLIVWSATFTKTSFELKDAYTSLKNDEKQVRDYLTAHGIAGEEAIFSSITIDKRYRYSFNDQGQQTAATFDGYQLRQGLKVESKDITKVEKISREITELLQSGIELSSQEPLYYYTQLSSLKIDLLAKAAADAHNRANTIAQNAKARLGNLRRASMGVFQITGQHSDEDYSYGGTFNTGSKNKTATITVRLEYELD